MMFTSNEHIGLTQGLANILRIKLDQIKIARIIEGSVVVTLEMPEESAQLLLSLFLAKDERLEKLKFIKVYLEPSSDSLQSPKEEENVILSEASVRREINISDASKIFISYSHKDENFKDELVTMLIPLQNQGVLKIWQDRYIEAGEEWQRAIKDAMNICDVALLLVSKHFLASGFISSEELPHLLQRRKEQGLRVIPIIISQCMWQSIPVLSDLQALPRDGKPVVAFKGAGERDKVWTEIAKAIERGAKKLR